MCSLQFLVSSFSSPPVHQGQPDPGIRDLTRARLPSQLMNQLHQLSSGGCPQGAQGVTTA